MQNPALRRVSAKLKEVVDGAFRVLLLPEVPGTLDSLEAQVYTMVSRPARPGPGPGRVRTHVRRSDVRVSPHAWPRPV
jgi:hypothetical protein